MQLLHSRTTKQALRVFVNLLTAIKFKGGRGIERTEDKIKDGNNGTVPIPSTGIDEPSAQVTGGKDKDNLRDEKMADIATS